MVLLYHDMVNSRNSDSIFTGSRNGTFLLFLTSSSRNTGPNETCKMNKHLIIIIKKTQYLKVYLFRR